MKLTHVYSQFLSVYIQTNNAPVFVRTRFLPYRFKTSNYSLFAFLITWTSLKFMGSQRRPTKWKCAFTRELLEMAIRQNQFVISPNKGSPLT